MKSIFEQTSTRIFCIAGSMDDIYCIKNGRVITSFEELLSCHLHNIGYEAVLFYSGAGKRKRGKREI